jgi:hypothetical protein
VTEPTAENITEIFAVEEAWGWVKQWGNEFAAVLSNDVKSERLT